MPRQPGESRRWRSAVWFPNDGTSRFLSSCSRQVWVSSSREMAARRMSLEFTRKRTKLTKTSVSLERQESQPKCGKRGGSSSPCSKFYRLYAFLQTANSDVEIGHNYYLANIAQRLDRKIPGGCKKGKCD